MSKIEIAIDVNGLEAKLCHWNTQKQKNFFKLHRVIPVIIVVNLDYNLFHSVMCVQQP